MNVFASNIIGMATACGIAVIDDTEVKKKQVNTGADSKTKLKEKKWQLKTTLVHQLYGMTMKNADD